MCLECVLKGYVRGQLGRAPFSYHIDSEGLSRRGSVCEIRCFCSRRCCEGACSQPFLLYGNCVTEGLKTDMVAAPSGRLCSLKPQDECPDDGLGPFVEIGLWLACKQAPNCCPRMWIWGEVNMV
jgi:hypothetical protein